MIDRSFQTPRPPVSIVAVGDSGEAVLLRAILENLGASVTLHLPGTPGDFLLVLGQGESAPDYLVICGHGDDNGLVFGEFVPEIDTTMLVAGSMPADVIAAAVDLPATIVVSTACETGSEAFSSAFLHGGAGAFIAPDGSPDGADAALFVHLLFHHLIAHKGTPHAALELARGHDEQFRMFVGRGNALL